MARNNVGGRTNMIEYKNPFIKVEWEDTPENHSPERIKRVKEYFQKKYNTKDVKIVPKSTSNNSKTSLKSLDVGDNILDYQYQKKLVQEFLTENKVNIKWELIDRLDNKVNSELDKISQANSRFNKWFIKKIEFSNFLSFGDDNVIDFTDLGGITVIESTPKNFGGKTTISINLLMFLFFNKTDKSKTNLDVFNVYRDDCHEVKVKGYVEIDGDEYIIERTVTRKMSKSGEYNVKSELNFYKQIENELINLSGEQRRETETFITSAIGTEEDFLTTILTTGYNLEELIDSKPTARGLILTRFLGLELLKQKEELCKNMYSNWSKTLVSNTYNIVALQNDIETFRGNIIDSEIEIKRLEKLLSNFEINLKTMEERRDLILQLRNNDIDEELFKVNTETIQKEIDKLIIDQKGIKLLIDGIKVVEPSKYYNEDDHEVVTKKVNDLTFKIRVNENDIKSKESFVNDLLSSGVCPTCKQSLKDVDHTEEIELTKKTIETLTKELDKVKKEHEKEVKKNNDFDLLKKEYELYERDKLRKSKHELEFDQKQLDIDGKRTKIEKYNSNKKKLDDNRKIDEEIVILRSKIDTEKGNIRATSNDIEKNKNQIITTNDKIKINDELIKKIKVEEEFGQTFKIYLSVFGKNGISKSIIKNMIPLLNQELHRLMTDSCYFTLEININDKNELEFIMIDNESRVVKSLSTGSGYEKTISALAIRSVLTKISSLPKPNIVVMDECFGKVADENLELIGEFFQKIKGYFEHIIIVSHNSLIRNWSDNIIMIKKDDNISSVEYITTKLR